MTFIKTRFNLQRGLAYVNVPVMIFAATATDISECHRSNVGNVLLGGSGSDRVLGPRPES